MSKDTIVMPAARIPRKLWESLEEIMRKRMLKSQTAATIVAGLLRKTAIVNVSENYRTICKNYIETPDKADILHAAACLQTGAILITNDHYFDKIRKERIIKVWSITEALQRLLTTR